VAWCPFAQRMEVQPESDEQPAITPTQMIAHSLAAPWTAQQAYRYWHEDTNLESHFGLGYGGDLGQYIGTQTRADANYGANRRADGTGAVSIETASNSNHTDPWTSQQVEMLIRLGVWLHQQHGIPLRLCRSHDDPGYGWHGMFPQWSPSGTACPGPARIKQFREVVFPGIVARATGQTSNEEDDMPTPQEIAAAVWEKRLPNPGRLDADGNPWMQPAQDFQVDQDRKFDLLDGQLKALSAQVAALETLLDRAGVDTAAIVAAIDAAVSRTVERELREGTVSVDVNVHGQSAG
jgi:N-acetylmuramoyl-L-alanine amidase